MVPLGGSRHVLCGAPHIFMPGVGQYMTVGLDLTLRWVPWACWQIGHA
eukprot:COSAG01_NODE_66578_length_269_cov_1.594118_1_plen_47_part_10